MLLISSKRVEQDGSCSEQSDMSIEVTDTPTPPKQPEARSRCGSGVYGEGGLLFAGHFLKQVRLCSQSPMLASKIADLFWLPYGPYK